MSSEEVYQRYVVGDENSTEFGLYHNEKNIKIEIKNDHNTIRIIIDDRCYDTGSCLVNDEFYESLLRK